VPQTQPAPAPISWPQVMLSQLSWAPGTIGVSDDAFQLPTLG
jgi:hypothetical protein